MMPGALPPKFEPKMLKRRMLVSKQLHSPPTKGHTSEAAVDAIPPLLLLLLLLPLPLKRPRDHPGRLSVTLKMLGPAKLAVVTPGTMLE
jgi:hypothetical protein